MTNDLIDYVTTVYDKEPCKKCGGQIMTVFIIQDIIDRRCIKCDSAKVRIRPECEDERKGRVMHIYNVTGHISDGYPLSLD